ncbi:MAG: hypothetical protein HDKAJFGB_03234 [Anaerolineae bacterium]|nr:hypothetical protein [Anaerolineae bacterium]
MRACAHVTFRVIGEIPHRAHRQRFGFAVEFHVHHDLRRDVAVQTRPRAAARQIQFRREFFFDGRHLMRRLDFCASQRVFMRPRGFRLRDERVRIERAEPRDETRAEFRERGEMNLQRAQFRLRQRVARIGGDERMNVHHQRMRFVHRRVVRVHHRVERAHSFRVRRRVRRAFHLPRVEQFDERVHARDDRRHALFKLG